MRDQDNKPRSLMDEILEEAAKNGTFSDTAKHGKPLNMRENPFVPQEQQLAFKILNDGGYAPAWIEDGKEIRSDIKQARESLAVAHRRFQRDMHRLQQKVNVEAVYQQKVVYDTWDLACANFRRDVQKINKKIFEYNLKVPIISQQMIQLDADREIEKYT